MAPARVHFSEKNVVFPENYKSSGRDLSASAWADLRGPRATVAPLSDRFSVPVAGLSRELAPRIDELVLSRPRRIYVVGVQGRVRQSQA